MREVTIYGPPASTYVRTALMTYLEKNIPHRREDIELGSDMLKKLHPFGKVPVLRDGENTIYEAVAIAL